MTNSTNDKKLIELIVRAMDDKKAEDIVLLDIAKLSIITDHFAIATGRSVTQVKAIADNVIDVLKKDHGIQSKGIEGIQEGKWVLIDYGDIIVHIFHLEQREFYNLERLWADAINIPVEQFLENK